MTEVKVRPKKDRISEKFMFKIAQSFPPPNIITINCLTIIKRIVDFQMKKQASRTTEISRRWPNMAGKSMAFLLTLKNMKAKTV